MNHQAHPRQMFHHWRDMRLQQYADRRGLSLVLVQVLLTHLLSHRSLFRAVAADIDRIVDPDYQLHNMPVMTSTQKIIIQLLLKGHTISAFGPGQIRLRDASGNPVLKISNRTFYRLKSDILRRKKLVFMIDLRKVRSLHGNCIANRVYKGKTTSRAI